MAYAELAGLPAVTGLYTTIACLVGYAIFGPSRVLVLGPDSSVSPLIFAAIVPLLAGGDPATAIALAGMLALFVGLIEIGLGLGKLGFVADLLSKEVQVGYMNGLGITIIVGQLPKLFGFSTDADSFIDEVRGVLRTASTRPTRRRWSSASPASSSCSVLPRLTRRVPAVLVAVVGATIVSAVLGLAEQGVKTVGALPQGVPTPAFPWTSISDVGPLLIAAVGITLVSLTDTIATSTSFAARRGDEVEPDQEMIGMGAANIAAGFFQGFAVSTSGSRTAVAEQSGAKSQVTGLVGAGLVAVLLLFLNGLLADLPADDAGRRGHRRRPLADGPRHPAAATSGCARARSRSRSSPPSASCCSACCGGSPSPSSWRSCCSSGATGGPTAPCSARSRACRDGTASTRTRTPASSRASSCTAGRPRSSSPTPASSASRSGASCASSQPSWVVLQCEAITDIDVTAAEMLEQLDKELNAAGVHLAFAELRDRLQDLDAALRALRDPRPRPLLPHAEGRRQRGPGARAAAAGPETTRPAQASAPRGGRRRSDGVPETE